MAEPSSHPPARSSERVRVDWRIAAACAATLIVAFSAQSVAFLAALGAHRSMTRIVLDETMTWGLWLSFVPLVFAIARSAHTRGVGTYVMFVLQIAASVAVAVLHSTLLAVGRWSLGITTGRLRAIVTVVIFMTFAANLLRYWLIAAVYHALAYHRQVRERAINEARLAASLAEARLESLERRLHPHFLFNTLNAISALIRKDPPAATAMVGNLSDLLRASLVAEPGSEITLGGELALLERYTAIQQARFSDRLRVSVAVAPELLGAYVPQMILQPIVENAIRHGIAPRETSGTLTLEAARRGQMLRLVVRDDGVGFARAPSAGAGIGIGIHDTRKRLAHLYGDEFSFDIGDGAPTGTVVTIDVPFHTDRPRGPRVVA